MKTMAKDWSGSTCVLNFFVVVLFLPTKALFPEIEIDSGKQYKQNHNL